MKLKRNFCFTGYFLFGSALCCLHYTAKSTPTKKGKKIRSREEGNDYSFSHHCQPKSPYLAIGSVCFLRKKQFPCKPPCRTAGHRTPRQILFSSVWKQCIPFLRMQSTTCPYLYTTQERVTMFYKWSYLQLENMTEIHNIPVEKKKKSMPM